jgi:hypothetical protein
MPAFDSTSGGTDFFTAVIRRVRVKQILAMPFTAKIVTVHELPSWSPRPVIHLRGYRADSEVLI